MTLLTDFDLDVRLSPVPVRGSRPDLDPETAEECGDTMPDDEDCGGGGGETDAFCEGTGPECVTAAVGCVETRQAVCETRPPECK